ncbi:MAG: hypothetical protein JWL71_2669 [Acidobacteria bacterium]|nr:hypothetical protein [Acidobacteriota bacterium]
MTTVDLRAEAAAEAGRLTAARALSRDGDVGTGAVLEGGAPWITRVRRRRLKAALGARMCAVWRVAFEDASGRVVESRLVPVSAPIPRGADRKWIAALLERTDTAVRERVGAESGAWRAEAVRTTGAFTAARLAREREIAGSRAAIVAGLQPGLFDRRAERSRDAGAAAIAHAEQTSHERRRAIVAAGTLTPVPARLLLVLVP